MPTATRTEYLQLDSLLMATRAINAHGYEGLKGTGDKRGDDVTIPGQTGVTPRDRIQGALRDLIEIQINGRWDHSTDAETADWREGAYTAYGLVLAKAKSLTVVTLDLVRSSGTTSVDCQPLDLRVIDEKTPWTWDCVLDVVLPDGPLL